MSEREEKRILFVLNSLSGGSSQGIYELLRGLKGSPYKVFLVGPSLPEQAQQISAIREFSEKYFYVPLTWWNKKDHVPRLSRLFLWARTLISTRFHLGSVIKICKIIRQNKIDLVYTSTTLPLEGALASKLMRVPHIWHLKESIGSKGWFHFPLPDPLLARTLAGLSSHLLVMSKFIGRILDGRVSDEKWSVILDAVPIEDYPSSPPPVKKGSDLMIGLVSSPASTVKRHAVFIKMAALLADEFPELKFGIYGMIPKQHRNPLYNAPYQYYCGLRELVKKLDLEDRVKWIDFAECIPDVMLSLDILVHTCEQEGFGRVAPEAMAAFRPVVGPTEGGITESVLHGETGFLARPGDEYDFAKYVKLLITDPDLRLRMGLAGRKRAEEFFSTQAHSRYATQVFDRVLSARSQ